MAAAPLTPRRTANGKRRGRPPGSTNAARAARLAAASSEPPPKRRKYIPGGPGGGGRFVDEDGVVTHVVGRGSGGRASTGSGSGTTRRTPATTGHTARIPRASAAAAAAASSPIYPRRERSTRVRTAVSRYEPDDDEQFSSAAAVAAAVAQSEGYKPREERGWEEFHPNLDIETTFMVFRAEDVDGTAAKATPAATPIASLAPGQIPAVNGLSSAVSAATNSGAESGTAEGLGLTVASDIGVAESSAVPSTAAPQSVLPDADSRSNGDSVGMGSGDISPAGTTPALPETPLRRRIGRPPRDLFGSYGPSTTPKTPKVLPIHNQTPKEKLDLKMPSYRKTDRILLFEGKTFGRYVDKSMMNVGYQETDIYIRPEQLLIKASDANAEEEIDAYHHAVGSDERSHPHVSHGIGSGSISSIGAIVPGGGAGSNGGVGRVEYDMDEQDDMWLAKYNATRKAVSVEPITREIFEITITKIEKEWHALEKRIPKPNPKPPQTHRPRSSSAAAVNGETTSGGEEQDSKCAICDDGDCENTNAIVFCDGCDLAVHQDCYGVPFIPEGQWHCRKCQLIGRGIPTCIFCPNTDGAFKQTNSSKWAHMLCAMWIPETSLGNTTFMEPVMDVEKVPKARWRLTCYICRQKMGACIQCGNKACCQAFHVTCARRARLYLKMKNSQGALAVLDNSMVLKAFCDRHCPPDYAKENAVHQATREAKRHYKRTMRGRIWADSRASALQMAATTHAMIERPADESQMTGARISAAMGAAAAAAAAASTGDGGGDATPSMNDGNKKKGGAQAAKPMWKLPSGAPVIPQAVFDIVETALQRFMLRRRREFVSEACRYWTLKREARRGAALLKRLQLQMETFTSMELTRRNFASMGPSGQARLERRIEFAETLLGDLEQLRSLAHDVVDRERDKLEAAEMEQDFVDSCYFPVYKLLAPIVTKASVYDKNVFRDGFLALQAKLNERFYTNALTFVHDLCDVIHRGINQVLEPEEPAELAVAPTADAHNSTNAEAAAATVVSLSEGVTNATGTPAGSSNVPPAAASLTRVNANSAYIEARDRKRLGKRILKAIQPMLEAAVRAESDITHVPADSLLKELEALLEASVELQPASATLSRAVASRTVSAAPVAAATPKNHDAAGGVNTVDGAADGYDDQIIVAEETGAETTGAATVAVENRRTDGNGAKEDKMDVDDGDGEATPRASARNGTVEIEMSTPKPVISLSDVLPNGASSVSDQFQKGTDGSLVDVSGGIVHPANGPLTPPQSHNGSVPGNGGGGFVVGHAASDIAITHGENNDAASGQPQPVDTLHEGGTLWFLTGFGLDGTTAAEEQWSGRDAVRSLSEDLTDMDDEELNGLEFDVEDNTIMASPVDAPSKGVSFSRRRTSAAPSSTATATDTEAAAAPTHLAPLPASSKRRGANTPLRKGIRSSARRR